MNWSSFEERVYEACINSFPKAKVTKDVKIRGRYSLRSRQVDILIEEDIGGNIISIAVDCKLYNKKVDTKAVESFIGMLDDIDVDRGLLISELGYTESALKRAHFNPKHIELDIYSLKELKDQLHGEIAIPYSHDKGVILYAPFGWIVDATKRSGAICFLYRRGLDLEQAGIERELAYVNFWHKETSEFSLKDLIDLQEKYMRESLETGEINYLPTIQRNDANTLLRIAEIRNYLGLELTAFVEFDDFIFFCVWFSRGVVVKRNIRKLESLIKSIIPVTIKQDTLKY